MSNNMPTYQDLVNALCDVMDGVQDHDVQSDTGLPEDESQFIIDVRRSVLSIWDVNGPREFRFRNQEKDGVSIVWDKDGKFFQVWQFDYNGDGRSHAEKVAKQINGTFLHIDPEKL